MADDRTRYEAVRVAEGALEDRLIRDEFSTESRLQRRRAWQLWVTSGIIALIVLGAVAMVFVIANYQNLAQGEIRRRLESVAVRRDLRSILRGTADGLIGVDQGGKCTFLNEAGSTLLGYAPSELRGQDVHSRIHHTRADGGEHSESDCPVHSALGSGETVRVPDDVLWRKDGTSFPVQLIVSPMKDARTVRGVVLTFTAFAPGGIAKGGAEGITGHGRWRARRRSRRSSCQRSRLRREVAQQLGQLRGRLGRHHADHVIAAVDVVHLAGNAAG